ncbi:zinc ribbon domain-containing protein [Lentzea sp. JNUCC 0626]|uniref:zinc ribbon domain-containing protein n=1 Tax=Lentzea sp. JNUCC 0626 TaxID=3367513 RepID=UPI00374A0427
MVRNRRLARSISDASWGEFRRQLEYKCARAGRTLVVVDRWYPSSKTCSCGADVRRQGSAPPRSAAKQETRASGEAK